MHRYYYHLLMALVVLLSAGCQSSRPAFYFGSRPAPAHRVLDASAVADSSRKVTLPEPASTPTPRVILPVRPRPLVSAPTRTQRPLQRLALGPLVGRAMAAAPKRNQSLFRFAGRPAQQHPSAHGQRRPTDFELSLSDYLLALLVVALVLAGLALLMKAVLGISFLAALGIIVFFIVLVLVVL